MQRFFEEEDSRRHRWRGYGLRITLSTQSIVHHFPYLPLCTVPLYLSHLTEEQVTVDRSFRQQYSMHVFQAVRCLEALLTFHWLLSCRISSYLRVSAANICLYVLVTITLFILTPTTAADAANSGDLEFFHKTLSSSPMLAVLSVILRETICVFLYEANTRLLYPFAISIYYAASHHVACVLLC